MSLDKSVSSVVEFKCSVLTFDSAIAATEYQLQQCVTPVLGTRRKSQLRNKCSDLVRDLCGKVKELCIKKSANSKD